MSAFLSRVLSPNSSNNVDDTQSMISDSSYSRAPDPTRRRKVATVNLKHKNNRISGGDVSVSSKNPLFERRSNANAAVALLEGKPLVDHSGNERKSLKNLASLKSTLPRFHGSLSLSGTLGRKKKKQDKEPQEMPHKMSTSKHFSAELSQPVQPEVMGDGSPRHSRSPEVLGRSYGSLLRTSSLKPGKKKTFTGSQSPLLSTGGRRVSDTSDGSLPRLRLTPQKEELPELGKQTLPKKMQELKSKYISALFDRGEKTKDKRTPQEEISKLSGMPVNALSSGASSEQFRFKQAMVEKLHSYGGSYGLELDDDYGPPMHRKGSSFNMENASVLLLGKSKAGKSTIFKQLLAMAGHPPNYARAYIPTKAAVEKEVHINDTPLQVVDIGGSKRDIVNWRFYLSSSELIIFVVALDEFDKLVVQKKLPEDDGKEPDKRASRSSLETPKTQLQESLELFESIIHNVALLNSRVVLVLNKADRFKKRLCDKKVSLASVGVYEGAPSSTNFDDAIEYIEEMFLAKTMNTDHELQIEVTNASDAEDCQRMLRGLTEGMVKNTAVTQLRNLL